MKFVLLVAFASVAVTAIGVIAGTKTDVDRAGAGSTLHLSDVSSRTGSIADSTATPLPFEFGPP
ncbi:hypothetical protein CEP88_08840 [Roseobacter denitrificans]|uniref:hypothetical protein n=1 Tax=Roseobacter denitrificans TaxID=2434 RepID=UPI0002DEB2A7|nr:hypothetical protein [Roseobacter denitrificans]AVL52689.1 hypothetical protein CEP88_08840 [Roseobacter denitrificans]